MSDDAYRKAHDEIVTRTCECVSCGSCHGSGLVMRPTGGYPEEDLERCDDCEGSGITEQCDRCADLMELERDFEL